METCSLGFSDFGLTLLLHFLILGLFLKQFFLKLFFASSFSFLFLGCIGLHLFELYFFIEAKFFEESSEYILIHHDGLSVIFIEADPYLESVTGRVIDFGRDEPKPIDFVTAFEVFSKEKKGKLLINFLLVCLAFGNLKDKPSSILISFVLPLGLDPLTEVLNGVYSFLGITHLVAMCRSEYAFCLLFGLRK